MTIAQAEGAIDGTADDYRLDSVVDATSKYSRFARNSRDVCQPRNVSTLTGAKRRVRHSGHNDVAFTENVTLSEWLRPFDKRTDAKQAEK